MRAAIAALKCGILFESGRFGVPKWTAVMTTLTPA